MADWPTYYRQHLSRPPRSLLVKAVSFCTNKDAALDLGAGTLVETKFLLDSGFKKVTALDSSPEIETFAEGIKDERLEITIKRYQDFVLLSERYDLINASYALPFYGTEGFEAFIERLISALRPGGISTGQLFGVKDGWNVPGKNMAFQTIEEAKGLLRGLEIELFTEEDKDGTVASGEAKHWHLFHFIARK
jgi:trans-aconitate methyltransferase